MYIPTTREIIKELKAERKRRNLSVPGVKRLCEEKGFYACINTFHAIFCNGSEDGSFSYEHTLRPIANVLLTKDRQQSSQMEIMEKQLELLANQLQSEREEHKRSISKLNEQIESLHKTIKEKDKLINELIEKNI